MRKIKDRWRRPLALLLSAIMLAGMLGAFPSLTFADTAGEEAAEQPTTATPSIDDEQVFKLTIKISYDMVWFYLPVNSYPRYTQVLPFDWVVDWGDGVVESQDGYAHGNGGIPHLYTQAGDYTITIRPNGSTEAWLDAFGFGMPLYIGYSSIDTMSGVEELLYSAQCVTGAPCSITPQMILTDEEIQGTAVLSNYDLHYTFARCTNMKVAPSLEGWEGIEFIGKGFATGMFYQCYSLTTLPESFNLPSGLVSAGDYFASAMFLGCRSLTSLPAGFNLPPDLTIVGDDFAASMFSGCRDLTVLPAGFNLPQGLLEVGSGFAASLFANCSSLGSLPSGFNTPQGLLAAGDLFLAYLLMGAGNEGFQINDEFQLPGMTAVGPNSTCSQAFQLSVAAPPQNRTATSIIGSFPTPTSQSNAFDLHFSDIDYIAVNWGGSGLTNPPDVQPFKLGIRIPETNSTFYLPTSSYLGGASTSKAYDWLIDWGDGSSEHAVGASSLGSGIAHEYEAAGDYTIYIKPNGSIEAWLAAFGFGNDYSYIVNSRDNKSMVISVPCALTPQMTRTTAQINGSEPAPDYELCSVFALCVNLTTAPTMEGWEAISSVGEYFCERMFIMCFKLELVPEGFNLPQNLTEAGEGFAAMLFALCSSLPSLPAGFNLPQNLTAVGDHFAQEAFSYCESLATLPEGFNLPQGLTEVGSSFAAGLFLNCSSLGSLPSGFNTPQGLLYAGDYFLAYLLMGAGNEGFQMNDEFQLPVMTAVGTNSTCRQAFLLSNAAPPQNRTAASIIGNFPTPGYQSNAFDSHFSDIDYIDVNWGGRGLPLVGPPGSGDLNGDGFVTMDEVLICAQAALGDIGLNPAQLDAIDMDRDGAITMADVMMIYKASVG